METKTKPNLEENLKKIYEALKSEPLERKGFFLLFDNNVKTIEILNTKEEVNQYLHEKFNKWISTKEIEVYHIVSEKMLKIGY